MRVGISILTHEGHNLWNNGMGQNVYHLARLIDAIPFVEEVVLLDCGDRAVPPASADAASSHFPVIPLREAEDRVDVAIEMSGALDIEWAARQRARGGRIVFHNCGQPYAALVEPTIFGKPGCFSTAERCDEIWLLPKDRQFTSMMRHIHRCPVHELPYLWAPNFLMATAGEGEGRSFGYQAGSLRAGNLVPAIFEPNVSPIKMGIIPFLICETIERRHPNALARIDFMNGAHMKERHSFVYLIENSDLHRAGKVAIQGRDYFAHVMARGANMVISHQLDVPQNYLYLDALFGGYPLVHNSPLFADAGYYYPESDVEAGAAQVELACREHDRNLAAYKTNSDSVIAALSPEDRRNRDAYARRLIALASHRGGRRAA